MEVRERFETRRWETRVSREISGPGMELDGDVGRDDWLWVGGDVDILVLRWRMSVIYIIL